MAMIEFVGGFGGVDSGNFMFPVAGVNLSFTIVATKTSFNISSFLYRKMNLCNLPSTVCTA